ncbi:MAG TPA: hypothetical protein VGQ39_12645 [Pyrinomonadaceae bacterium]|jgi:hypothetical protein|nr:hypothetical protein [Pyrinomonadaceae bacterium]
MRIDHPWTLAPQNDNAALEFNSVGPVNYLNAFALPFYSQNEHSYFTGGLFLAVELSPALSL